MMKSITAYFALSVALLLSLLAPAQAQNGETALTLGDQIRITITGVPAGDQQSMALQTYIISNEGTIRLQHLKSEVRAVGMTPTALARSLEASYKAAKIYTNPAINISRNETGITIQTVTVSGNVKLGGSAPWRPKMRIIDAIADKGGPDDFANMKAVKLIRGQKTQVLDLSNISSHPERNVSLLPGDLIMVPAAGMNPFKKNN
jgi:protein involved in polysaccharide export with SLBB domain